MAKLVDIPRCEGPRAEVRDVIRWQVNEALENLGRALAATPLGSDEEHAIRDIMRDLKDLRGDGRAENR